MIRNKAARGGAKGQWRESREYEEVLRRAD